MMDKYVTVVGAGLAGCEAAWQLAQRGIGVKLYEMKGQKKTPAHVSEDFAELVFIIQGSLQNEMPDECMSLQAGDVILFAPGSCHHYKRIRNSRHFTILFSLQLLQIFPSFMTSLSNYQYFLPKKGQVSKILHLDLNQLTAELGITE